MKSVSWLTIDSLDSGKGQFDAYFERLKEVAPTPRTEIVSLDTSQREPWNVEDIQDAMESLGVDRAFVRTMQKAAPQDVHRGSIIQSTEPSEINTTISSLLTQIANSEWKHGGKLAVRELINLRFCMGSKHTMCHPEVRYFIEGGEVLYKTPHSVEVTCPSAYSHLDELVENSSPPDELAQKVAEEFTELPWAADFAMDTGGKWYCVELNLNGVRWDEEQGGWRNMCGQGGREAYSPQVIHSPVLKRFKDGQS